MPEIVHCPQCERSLRVPDDLLGKRVKCPTCATHFTAAKTQSSFEEVPDDEPEADERPSSIRERLSAMEKKATLRRSADEREEEDGYEEVDDRPSRPGRPRRRRSRGKPHRGNLILTFGLLAWFTGLAFVFGPMAWIMGNNDLIEMRAGRMDREGEGLTNTGRILGMISTVFVILGVLCGLGMFLFFLFLGAKTRH